MLSSMLFAALERLAEYALPGRSSKRHRDTELEAKRLRRGYGQNLGGRGACWMVWHAGIVDLARKAGVRSRCMARGSSKLRQAMCSSLDRLSFYHK